MWGSCAPLPQASLLHIHVMTQLVAVRVSGFMSSNLILLCSVGVKFLKRMKGR